MKNAFGEHMDFTQLESHAQLYPTIPLFWNEEMRNEENP